MRRRSWGGTPVAVATPGARRRATCILQRFAAVLVCLVSAAILRASGTYEVVVYGASSSGVIAAVQAARMGKATALISTSAHVGGMTASGLGTTDTGNAATISGLAYTFYANVYRQYHPPGDATANPAGVQFDFEPHVAEHVFQELLRSAGVTVILNEQLDRSAGADRLGVHLRQIRMQSGATYVAKVFIDATYEGDLMAAAGVSFRIGREGRAEFGESLAGVYRDNWLAGEVDPYYEIGNPASGVLPGVQLRNPGPDGTGDTRVQQYNLRLCVTNDPANRIPFARPSHYDRANYELLRRRLIANPTMTLQDVVKVQPLPGRKADINATGSFSTDMAGDESTQWATASDGERVQLLQRYRDYTQGLFWFLVHDPGVPLQIRQQAAAWGLAADEFTDSNHWPWQLYVREARRMIGVYTLTQRDCEGQTAVPDSIALGSYGMDSHKVTLFIDTDGRLNTEGFFFVGVTPYPISYRAITPLPWQCDNLLVPICLSASHVAYNSLRMEPVYMMLGQSAGTAACLAVDAGSTVQQVNYAALGRQLTADGQLLTWNTTAAQAAAAYEVVDEPENTAPAPKPAARRGTDLKLLR